MSWVSYGKTYLGVPELPPPQVGQCQQFLLPAWTAFSSWTVSAVFPARLNCLLLKLNSVSSSYCPPELPHSQVGQCQQFLLPAWTASFSSWTVSAVLTAHLNCLILKLDSVSSSYCPPELPPSQVGQCKQFLLPTWTASFQVGQCQQFLMAAWTASFSSWTVSAVLTAHLNCLILKLDSVSSSYWPPELPPSQVEQCQQFLLPAWTASSSSWTVSAVLTAPELPSQVEQCQQFFLLAWTASFSSWTVSAVVTARLNYLILKLNSVSSSYCPPELPHSQVEQCQQFLLPTWTASSSSRTVSAVLPLRLNCLLLQSNSVSSSSCPPELPPPQVVVSISHCPCT